MTVASGFSSAVSTSSTVGARSDAPKTMASAKSPYRRPDR